MSDFASPLLSAIGVMSGTSMDAIDVALIESDGETQIRIQQSGTFHYPSDTKSALLDLIADPARIETDDLTAIEHSVTVAHCAAVEAFLDHHNIKRGAIDLVGFHGQTVLHRPDKQFTCQLFHGAYAAKRLGISVVNRFRHRDMEAGGQGAPLAPLYHHARAHTLTKPLAILNLGGVANVTLIDEANILAFDTGPASALMDDVMRQRRGEECDWNGEHARAGKIDERILTQYLSDPYFARRPPKSLDRNAFHHWLNLVAPLSLDDAMATLAAFTVESIAKAREHANPFPRHWLVAGGGRHNHYLMQQLAMRLGVPVEPVETVGWNGDMLEAECFAWLAIRAVKHLPISLPSTTGVREPMTGGVLHRALHRALRKE